MKWKAIIPCVAVVLACLGCDMYYPPLIQNGYPFTTQIRVSYEDGRDSNVILGPNVGTLHLTKTNVVQSVSVSTTSGRPLASYSREDINQKVPAGTIPDVWLVSPEGLFPFTTKEYKKIMVEQGLEP
jgi:hypothetical protein